jgi:hypothetical protein
MPVAAVSIADERAVVDGQHHAARRWGGHRLAFAGHRFGTAIGFRKLGVGVEDFLESLGDAALADAVGEVAAGGGDGDELRTEQPAAADADFAGLAGFLVRRPALPEAGIGLGEPLVVRTSPGLGEGDELVVEKVDDFVGVDGLRTCQVR